MATRGVVTLFLFSRLLMKLKSASYITDYTLSNLDCSHFLYFLQNFSFQYLLFLIAQIPGMIKFDVTNIIR